MCINICKTSSLYDLKEIWNKILAVNCKFFFTLCVWVFQKSCCLHGDDVRCVCCTTFGHLVQLIGISQGIRQHRIEKQCTLQVSIKSLVFFSHSCFGNEKEREKDKHADRQKYILPNKLTENNTKYIIFPAPAEKKEKH